MNPPKPTCTKCKKSIANKIIECAECSSVFHPNCLRHYAATKDARACCIASYTRINSSLEARRRSDRLEISRNLSRADRFDSGRNLSPSAAFNVTTGNHASLSQPSPSSYSISNTPSNQPSRQSVDNGSNSTSQTLPLDFNSAVQERMREFAAVPPDQQLAFFFQEMVQNQLRNDAAMATFRATVAQHGQRLNSLETLREQDRSEVLNKIQDVKQSVAYVQYNKPTAEIVVGGLPVDTTLSEIVIAERIFSTIGAEKFVGDIVSCRRLPYKRSGKDTHSQGQSPRTFSMIIQFKGTYVRNEVMRLKRLFGEILVPVIFTELVDKFVGKVVLNEWLHPHVHQLLTATREKAKSMGYERVWVRDEQISVRKNEHSPKIDIFTETDLAKLI